MMVLTYKAEELNDIKGQMVNNGIIDEDIARGVNTLYDLVKSLKGKWPEAYPILKDSNLPGMLVYGVTPSFAKNSYEYWLILSFAYTVCDQMSYYSSNRFKDVYNNIISDAENIKNQENLPMSEALVRALDSELKSAKLMAVVPKLSSGENVLPLWERKEWPPGEGYDGFYNRYLSIARDVNDVLLFISSAGISNISMWWDYASGKFKDAREKLDDLKNDVYNRMNSLDSSSEEYKVLNKIYNNLTEENLLFSESDNIDKSEMSSLISFIRYNLKNYTLENIFSPGTDVFSSLRTSYQTLSYIDDYTIRNVLGFTTLTSIEGEPEEGPEGEPEEGPEEEPEEPDMSVIDWDSIISEKKYEYKFVDGNEIIINRKNFNLLLSMMYGPNCEILDKVADEFNLFSNNKTRQYAFMPNDDPLTKYAKFIKALSVIREYNPEQIDNLSSLFKMNHPDVFSQVTDINDNLFYSDPAGMETVKMRAWDSASLLYLINTLSNPSHPLNRLNENDLSTVLSYTSQLPFGYKILGLYDPLLNNLFNTNLIQNGTGLYMDYMLYMTQLYNSLPYYLRYNALTEFNLEIPKEIGGKFSDLDLAQRMAITANQYGFYVNDPYYTIPQIIGIPQLQDDLARIYNTMVPYMSYLGPVWSYANLRRYYSARAQTTMPYATYNPSSLRVSVPEDVMMIGLSDAYRKVYDRYLPISLKITNAELKSYARAKGITESEIKAMAKASGPGGLRVRGEAGKTENKSYELGEREVWLQSKEINKYFQLEAQNYRFYDVPVRDVFVSSLTNIVENYGGELQTSKIEDNKLIGRLNITGGNVVVFFNGTKEMEKIEEGGEVSDKEKYNVEARVYVKFKGGWYLITDRNFYDEFDSMLEKNGMFARMNASAGKLRTGLEYLQVRPFSNPEDYKTGAWGAFIGYDFGDTSAFLAKSKENESALTVTHQKSEGKFITGGLYLLNDKDLSYAQSTTPGEAMKGVEERYVGLVDYLVLDKFRASAFAGGREGQVEIGGRIVTPEVGVGFGIRHYDYANDWFTTSTGWSTDTWVGRAYYQYAKEKGFGLLTTKDFGNIGDMKDVSLDVYGTNADVYGTPPELKPGKSEELSSILNSIQALNDQYRDLILKGNKEAEGKYQDKMLDYTKQLISLLDDMGMRNYVFNSPAFTGFRLRWIDKNGHVRMVKVTATRATVQTEAENVDEAWLSAEYYLAPGGVPTTVFISAPVASESGGGTGSVPRPKWMTGLRFDLKKATFSMVGYPTTTGGFGLEGGVARPTKKGMVGGQASVELEKGRLPEYTLRVTYGRNNYAYTFELDKNLAGKFSNLVGLGAGMFSRRYILNGSAAYLWSRTSGGAFVDAFNLGLSGGFKFPAFGRDWSLSSKINLTRPIRPLGTKEYSVWLYLSTTF